MDGLAVPGIPVNDVQVMVVHGNFLKDINRRREEFLGRPWLSNLFEFHCLTEPFRRGFSAEKFRKSFGILF